MDVKSKYTLRVNRAFFEKLRYLAKREGRSINREIVWCIRAEIAKFEAARGTIPPVATEPHNLPTT